MPSADRQGHPAPMWLNDVAAGLLALGSMRFIRLPGRIQWQWVAKRSPMTVAGAASDFRL